MTWLVVILVGLIAPMALMWALFGAVSLGVAVWLLFPIGFWMYVIYHWLKEGL